MPAYHARASPCAVPCKKKKKNMNHPNRPTLPPKSNPPTSIQRKVAGKSKYVKNKVNLSYYKKKDFVKLKNEGMSMRRVVAETFGINESTIISIYQKKDHILARFQVASNKEAHWCSGMVARFSCTQRLCYVDIPKRIWCQTRMVKMMENFTQQPVPGLTSFLSKRSVL